MPPHMTPANDAARATTRDLLGMSIMDVAPRAGAMSVAWDEAAACLARRDSAGFDAAMRIFRKLDPKGGK